MRTRLRFLALVCVCFASAAAHADEASEALVKSFIDRIDREDAWSASAMRISSEGKATIVEGLKIARTDGSANFEAAAIRLDELGGAANGGIALAGIAANGLKLGGTQWTFTIPEATGRGITTTGFSGWNFNPKTPFTSLARLYGEMAKTELDGIAIPKAELSQEFEIPGVAAKTTSKAIYINFRLDALKKGILAAASIERIEDVTNGSTPEPVTTVIEGMSVANFDLGALAHVFDPAAYAGGKGDGLWKTVFENGSYAKLTVKTGDRDAFAAGPISASQWQVRQTPGPLAALLDDLVAASDSGGAGFDRFMEENIATLIGWIKIGQISIKDIAGFPPNGGKIALAAGTIEDLSAESMKRLALEKFSADSPEVAAKFRNFELGDVVWPSASAIVTLAKLEDAKNSGTPPDPLLAEKAASELMNVIPHVGKLSLSGVEVGVPGGEPFKLGEYAATSEGGMTLLPKTAKAKISAIVIPSSVLHMSPDSGQIFDTLGYSQIVIDGEGETDHDEATGRYSGHGRIAVKDAGALSLSHAIGGLTNERIKAIMTPLAISPSGEPDQVLAAAAPVSIENFTLRFDDASLTKRVLAIAAKMQNMSEATLIANTTAMLQLTLAWFGNQAFTGEAVSAFGTFLKDPKSLTLALRPAQPVTVRQLMNADPSKPAAIIDLLGLHVTAND